MAKKILTDIQTYLTITITTIAILLFDLLGKVGLAVYGILMVYSLIFLFFNIKRTFCTSFSFYIAITFFIYFAIATIINGGIDRFGNTVIQLFCLTLISFYHQKTNEIRIIFIQIAKILTVLSLIMAIGSILLPYIATKSSFYINGNLSDYLLDLVKSKINSFDGRLRGLTGHPNSTAEFCFVASTLSIFLLSNNEKKWFIPSFANILLSIFLIFIATSSRTNMLSILSFVFIYFISYFLMLEKNNIQYEKIFKAVIVLCIIVFVLFLLILLMFPQIRNFFLTRVIRISTLDTGSGRLDVYKAAYELGKGHRFLGFNYRELFNATGQNHAHNLLLHLLSFSGLPGLILFLVYYIYTLIISLINLNNNKLLPKQRIICCFFFSFIASYFIAGLTESGGINRLSLISVIAMPIFAYTHVIYFNSTNNMEESNE